VADAIVLNGAPVLGDWVHSQRSNVVLIGPDEASLQRVAQAAARLAGTLPCATSSATATARCPSRCPTCWYEAAPWC
jgi:ATP-dependent protease Clp ATPase subunit